MKNKYRLYKFNIETESKKAKRNGFLDLGDCLRKMLQSMTIQQRKDFLQTPSFSVLDSEFDFLSGESLRYFCDLSKMVFDDLDAASVKPLWSTKFTVSPLCIDNGHKPFLVSVKPYSDFAKFLGHDYGDLNSSDEFRVNIVISFNGFNLSLVITQPLLITMLTKIQERCIGHDILSLVLKPEVLGTLSNHEIEASINAIRGTIYLLFSDVNIMDGIPSGFKLDKKNNNIKLKNVLVL